MKIRDPEAEVIWLVFIFGVEALVFFFIGLWYGNFLWG